MKKKLFLIVALVLCAIWSAFAQTKSVAELEKAAKKDPKAMVELGYKYQVGDGVTQDYAKALEWYQKAAKKKSAEAETALGRMYYSGLGVAQNYAEAIKHFEKAAKQNNGEALSYLGDCYRDGKGVAKNDATAGNYYKDSADNGDLYGQFQVFCGYQNGIFGFPQDVAKAHELLEKSANGGLYLAQYQLGYYSLNGAGGYPVDYNSALKYFSLSATQGYTASMTMLGIMYRDGLGVEIDEKTAEKWLLAGANSGAAWQEYELGCLYNNMGRWEDSKIWMEKAAAQGHQQAAGSLQTLREMGFIK